MKLVALLLVATLNIATAEEDDVLTKCVGASIYPLEMCTGVSDTAQCWCDLDDDYYETRYQCDYASYNDDSVGSAEEVRQLVCDQLGVKPSNKAQSSNSNSASQSSVVSATTRASSSAAKGESTSSTSTAGSSQTTTNSNFAADLKVSLLALLVAAFI
ncbi:uncharacterized protein J8A68_000427 [[Candida] subhashii]|uniref:Extracellular membrane protein CFEM domain-containing protein n=1 Tax=[Candida] subhashii TaxID=561895 RepID=A0A8J5QN05_9ASCO|nr:uncharacterized protein J8A68_000427 [[Candida] subhashii]KAG7665997.1 hypothetical protein J8A68_000427 [[Candida] subhashii]